MKFSTLSTLGFYTACWPLLWLWLSLGQYGVLSSNTPNWNPATETILLPPNAHIKGDVWALDQVINIHVVVRHEEFALICNDLSKVRQILKREGMRPKTLPVSLKPLCNPIKQEQDAVRARRGLLQDAWGAIGSILGLQQSPFKQQFSNKDWHVLELNQHQLQKQIKELANKTLQHLTGLQKEINRNHQIQTEAFYLELVTDLKQVFQSMLRQRKLLSSGYIPEMWQDALSFPIQTMLQKIPRETWTALSIPNQTHPSEMAKQVWNQIRDQKLMISTHHQSLVTTEIVIHLPLSRQRKKFVMHSWENVEILPMFQNKTKMVLNQIEMWKVSDLEWFLSNDNDQAQLSPPQVHKQCMFFNQDHYCANLVTFKKIDSCESALWAQSPKDILRKCPIKRVFKPEIAIQISIYEWVVACAKTLPTSVLCPEHTHNFLCNLKPTLVKLAPSCRLSNPNFHIQSTPDSWEVIKEISLGPTQNLSSINFTLPTQNPKFHLSDRPLKDALASHYQEVEDQIDQYWFKVICIVSGISLCGLVLTLVGILYCTVKYMLNSN